MVNRRQHKWKQRLEESSSGRVTKVVYYVGEHSQRRPRMRWSNDLHNIRDYLSNGINFLFRKL